MELLYNKEELQLAKKPTKSISDEVFEKAIKHLHKNKKFEASMLADTECNELLEAINNVLSSAVKSNITQQVPPELTGALLENTFIFSGWKTFHQLREASLMLVGEDGTFKSFEKFKEDTLSIHNTYNVRYLEAEYNYAVQSTQMAVKWNEFAKDGDDYNLQYRTAGDDKVRADHAALHNTTLPLSDKFWDKYFPPLGWNCRCTVVQVRKDKYEVSDSAAAIKAGEAATDSKKSKIFRFNPGKTMKVYPPKHPQLPKCKTCVPDDKSEQCIACALFKKKWSSRNE